MGIMSINTQFAFTVIGITVVALKWFEIKFASNSLLLIRRLRWEGSRGRTYTGLNCQFNVGRQVVEWHSGNYCGMNFKNDFSFNEGGIIIGIGQFYSTGIVDLGFTLYEK